MITVRPLNGEIDMVNQSLNSRISDSHVRHFFQGDLIPYEIDLQKSNLTFIDLVVLSHSGIPAIYIRCPVEWCNRRTTDMRILFLDEKVSPVLFKGSIEKVYEYLFKEIGLYTVVSIQSESRLIEFMKTVKSNRVVGHYRNHFQVQGQFVDSVIFERSRFGDPDERSSS